MSFGAIITKYRRELGLTQEALANQLGVTNQAVSKWESDQTCPDISLLPKIADLFGVTIDQLFGREGAKAEPAADLPWEDDKTMRVVVYVGHQLIAGHPAAQEVHFCYEGPALNIHSELSVYCNDVSGSVDAGGDINCDDVSGPATAQGSINCNDVHGPASAEGDINCDYVHGSVNAGGNVTCDDVEGDVRAGGDVTCDCVDGDVRAGGDVTCDEVAGNINAGGNVTCDEVEGSVTAGGQFFQ